MARSPLHGVAPTSPLERISGMYVTQIVEIVLTSPGSARGVPQRLSMAGAKRDVVPAPQQPKMPDSRFVPTPTSSAEKEARVEKQRLSLATSEERLALLIGFYGDWSKRYTLGPNSITYLGQSPTSAQKAMAPFVAGASVGEQIDALTALGKHAYGIFNTKGITQFTITEIQKTEGYEIKVSWEIK